ncbi:MULTISPECIES: TetR/AcrR family transcriptional regulator [Myxococcus]|uniref:TetR/AcrR family transcriptional regulator n=1 Tax=Myxococcus TaxID=32 RepID=UPI0013D363E1|nr:MULTISPECIES: TetR/AcrR family transcriptional regulator [Myxococcus]NVJ26484.1 TetR family transcriptional regulator [Myxococcus sp. AM011]
MTDRRRSTTRSPARRPKAAGRQRDAEQTRADLLRAGRMAFATRGYAQAGMREIATAAGVTPALVVRYFGSKKELFREAIGHDVGLSGFFAADRKDFGRHVVQYLMSKPVPEADTLAMLLLSAGDAEVRDLVTTLLEERLTRPLAQWLGPPKAESRAALLLALFCGVWTFRSMVPMKPFAGTLDAATAAMLAAMLQDLVDGG